MAQRLHLVGIGGAGLSAYATALLQMGHRVSGSDRADSPVLDRLRELGADVVAGHAAANVGEVDAVVISTAVPADNPEVVEAERLGIPVLRRVDLLAAMCALKPTVAVSGTSGKTTTTAMLATILMAAGQRPSYVIGADVPALGGPARWDPTGEWFVVEADESDGTFLSLGASAVVVTTVEPDHLDQWGTTDALVDAFRRFLSAAPGPRIAGADDPVAGRLAHEVGADTFGTDPAATWRIDRVRPAGTGVAFDVEHRGGPAVRVELGIPGLHNARNATAALAVAAALGVDPADAARALAGFTGVARRFEHRGERDGVTFVDDYAHNPGKVAAVLAAARSGPWDRVVCVFQPHLYTRTRDLAPLYADAFVDADVLVVTDVYGAREAPIPGVTGRTLVDAVLGRHPGAAVHYEPDRSAVAARVRSLLRAGDLCLSLSAGDLTALPDEVLAAW